MQEEENDNLPKLSLEEEIQYKKLKLTLEKNIQFGGMESNNINLEQELSFLDYIEKFSEQFETRGTIVLYKKIGEPKFEKSEYVSDFQLEEVLMDLLQLFDENDIVLDVLAEYENKNRLIYEFIINEFFWLEIDDFVLPGMKSHFIYEEFHPNDQYDVDSICVEIINAFFTKESFLYDRLYHEHAAITYAHKAHRKLFKKLKVKSLIKNFSVISEDTATAEYEIVYWGKIQGDKNKIFYDGIISLTLSKQAEFWEVDSIELPF